MNLFRNLTGDEIREFKDWARQNYVPFSEIKGIWHPVIQQECARINEKEKNLKLFTLIQREGELENSI